MFCRNDMQKSSEIWNLIKESPELLSLCYIPINSYTVCLTLKESIETEGGSDIPRTITELYKKAIKILLFRHHLRYKDKPVPKNYIVAKLPDQLQNDLNQLIVKLHVAERFLVRFFSLFLSFFVICCMLSYTNFRISLFMIAIR